MVKKRSLLKGDELADLDKLKEALDSSSDKNCNFLIVFLLLAFHFNLMFNLLEYYKTFVKGRKKSINLSTSVHS